MTLKITLHLEETDLKYFAKIMVQTKKAVGCKDEASIIERATAEFKKAKKAKVPAFVSQRLDSLQLLLDMLKDPEWVLSKRERVDVFAALAYFIEPADLIHDDIPVLGFIDDAIMIELVVRELQHEIDAYRDFAYYKKEFSGLRGKGAGPASREEWLANKRNQLHNRMRRRRSRMYQRISRSRANRPRLRLF